MITLISYLFEAYTLAIFVYVLMSWFPGAYQSSLGRFLSKICQPYLSLFDFIPPIMGVSFAPWVALIVLGFVERGLIGLLLTIF